MLRYAFPLRYFILYTVNYFWPRSLHECERLHDLFEHFQLIYKIDTIFTDYMVEFDLTQVLICS